MGFSKKEDAQKVALFLPITGSEALDMFNCLQLTQAEETNYEMVLQKMDFSSL